jgi:hypothetical protein
MAALDMPSKAVRVEPASTSKARSSGRTASASRGTSRAAAVWAGAVVNLDRHLGDDPERPAAADEQLAQGDGGVVLAQAVRQGQGRARRVGQHHLQAQDMAAHVAIAQEPRSAGIGSRHAAQGGIGAQVDGQEQAVRLQRRVQRRQPYAGPDRGRAVGDVDLQRRGQAVQRQHQVRAAGVRRRALGQAGIGALRHELQAVLNAVADHRRDPRRRGRADDRRRRPAGVAGGDLVGGAADRIEDQAAGPDQGGQGVLVNLVQHESANSRGGHHLRRFVES